MEPLYIILIILAAAVLIIGIWALTEPHILDMTKIRLDRKDAPADKPCMRIFFFSDLHGEFCFISTARLIREIEKANEEGRLDAVVFGGDIATRKMFGSTGAKYLAKIAAYCRNAGIPFYGVLGNHDVLIPRTQINDCGFEDIGGKCIVMDTACGMKVALAGVTDSGRKHRQWYQLPDIPEGLPCVCVVHDPDAMLHFDAKPDWAVSGHFHGGQIKLPFRLEFLLIRRHDELPVKGVVEGLHEINGVPTFISRGIGCGSLPIRLRSLPEASVIEFF